MGGRHLHVGQLSTIHTSATMKAIVRYTHSFFRGLGYQDYVSNQCCGRPRSSTSESHS